MRSALFRRVPADPPYLGVDHAGRSFQVALRRRPTAKRITLRVSSATGEVVLTLPERIDLTAAQKFANAHGDWIATRLARVPERVSFRPGAILPLRGKSHRIVHWSIARGATRVVDGPGGDALIAVSAEARHVPRRVREFLEAEAKRDFGAAVRRVAGRLGVTPRRITVRDTKSRWGSCSAKGALSFSWRLILAPSFVIDYLAAHEVGHLREMNHSARFWRLVNEVCPRTQEAELWLKLHGTGLHRFG